MKKEEFKRIVEAMSTEELMANQMNLQQLQQQLNSEYNELNNNLQGRNR